MQRRSFLLAAASTALTGVAVSGCGTTSTASATDPKTTSTSQKQGQIDAAVDAGLSRLYSAIPGSRELVAKSNGMLIFPSVIAAGLGIGGEYGEGALRVNNRTEDYYNLASVSFGLQIGAQSKMIGFLFMTQDGLDKFRKSAGWSVGADASVAVLKTGANGAIDINSVNAPVVAFVLTNAGLMANLTLSGTKITKLKA
ncbi:YSC84-related protein [Oxalobacteraceae bacterium R-40]|uniref:YSC84-related protein n=1 Tax=Keguizhuia sedimenti TaxID=3064264 RepID=A0ABU1BNJ5_9BURK|nr:YSC84-related protein [Oxalobacteraceae bacterium R-40]MDQ9172089.1 YSC84-related protein [Oxalobacteraceae bacterium R-40]